MLPRPQNKQQDTLIGPGNRIIDQARSAASPCCCHASPATVPQRAGKDRRTGTSACRQQRDFFCRFRNHMVGFPRHIHVEHVERLLGGEYHDAVRPGMVSGPEPTGECRFEGAQAWRVTRQ